MNMVMVTSQMSPTSSAASNAGTQASGKAADGNANGFAGALVQALVGDSNGAAQAGMNGSLLTANVASLLGQAQTQQGEPESGTGLIAMLSKLLDLLQGEGQDAAATDDESAGPSAELLASVQDLLNQLNLLQIPATTIADRTNLQGEASLIGGTQAASLATLMPMLLQSLKEASQKAGQLEALAEPMADLAQKMQEAIAAAAATNQAASAQPAAQAAKSAAVPSANPLQAAAAQSEQPAASIASAEPRKPVSAFKEPIVYWNLADSLVASEQPADVPVVTAAANAQQASDQSVPFQLTLPNNTLQTTADAGKAALPAQVPVQQFTEQVGNYLVKQFTLSGGEGVATAKLTLHPDHLGQVDIRIAMQDGQMTAQFVAHNGTAKELLENQMSLLRTALQGQGIQVERMDVVQQSDLTSQTSFLGQEQRESESGRSGGQASRHGRDGSNDEWIDFEAEMERSSVLREAGYGSSINVTA
ncbi:flagellar hook-length control protein FliK [Cohnella lubricantis]|uniref:Flagellar hook-length control protein FliK n=1 Tax=Cohnella lubricantis TaxID=2163172 RepID=A0A841TEF9_9BACL|nr:flagellar hook-length control protein FliK [Cohnella lubricantis]MBB6679412.1 flagellar hook-length control protein FliK [Cohnella lubricantis]MBP2117494.1 flagellar hook-length control protein FliK [Cohnella lubricantis]